MERSQHARGSSLDFANSFPTQSLANPCGQAVQLPSRCDYDKLF
jgi:hypothetical protein